jgi:hypothetical protein
MAKAAWFNDRKPRVEYRDIAPTIPEWRLQAAAVAELRRMIDAGWPFAIAADMNAGKRSMAQAGIAKATGMEAGEPDLRIYWAPGRTGFIEMKGARTPVSPAQKVRHARLRELGHLVTIVQVKTEDEARDAVVRVVKTWIGVEGIG